MSVSECERKLFPQDWIEFEEIADLEERAKSQFFEKAHEEVVLKTQEAAKEKEFQSVPAGPAGAVEVSFILLFLAQILGMTLYLKEVQSIPSYSELYVN